MSSIVLDASVAVKWFSSPGQETLVEEAAAIGERYQAGEISLVVPDLFWAEVANYFWKGVQQHRFAPGIAHTSIEMLRSQNFPTIPSFDLIDQALHIALAFKRSAYDSIYIALAMQLGTHLITADERLANAVGIRLPVKWLGML